MTIKNDLEITSYAHCARCLGELPKNETPESYARYAVGFTKIGLQVWCNRHDCNIIHIDFEGAKHPANMTRRGDN